MGDFWREKSPGASSSGDQPAPDDVLGGKGGYSWVGLADLPMFDDGECTGAQLLDDLGVELVVSYPGVMTSPEIAEVDHRVEESNGILVSDVVMSGQDMDYIFDFFLGHGEKIGEVSLGYDLVGRLLVWDGHGVVDNVSYCEQGEVEHGEVLFLNVHRYEKIVGVASAHGAGTVRGIFSEEQEGPLDPPNTFFVFEFLCRHTEVPFELVCGEPSVVFDRGLLEDFAWSLFSDFAFLEERTEAIIDLVLGPRVHIPVWDLGPFSPVWDSLLLSRQEFTEKLLERFGFRLQGGLVQNVQELLVLDLVERAGRGGDEGGE